MKTYAQRLIELDLTYAPANRHFTTREEADYITEVLGLKELNDFELQNMRDMAVMFFDTDKWDTMMSVTAVIDDEKFIRRLAV